MTSTPWGPDDLMVIACARLLRGRATCFVGIGLPTIAALLAQRSHAPDLFLIYESGTLGVRPAILPLSVADHALAETSRLVVSVPEVFNYWLQPGRIDVGILGGAQIDRFANINSTTIGPYDRPTVRLPGAGGAPEIAGAAGETIVIIRQSTRSFVDPIDFVSSVGHGDGPGSREQLGLRGRGPTTVITDIGVYHPHPETSELVLTHVQPGATVEDAQAATGWNLIVAETVGTVDPPTSVEIATVRTLYASRLEREGPRGSGSGEQGVFPPMA